MKKDIEEDAYDIDGEYQIVWDKNGCPYIICKGKVIFTNLMCATKAFNII